MARTKQKREEDEVERLQREIRELKTLNRSLMKRLKKVDREYAEKIEEEDSQKSLEQDYIRTERSAKCGHCGKGQIVDVDIVGRKFQRCSVCDWKSGRRVS